MKTLGKLKLNHLSDNVLDDSLQNALKGGASPCGCTCGGCACGAWDGTGSIPPGQSSNDSGRGSVSDNFSGTVNHGI